MMESGPIDQPKPQQQMWCEKKQTAVHEEIKRMNQLPANSAYGMHRLKVLNKILQLMSVKNCITGAGVGVAFCGPFSVRVIIDDAPHNLHLEGQRGKHKACGCL